MERPSLVLLGLLAGCALQSRPQTGDRPVAVGTITEQQSHTTALLQAVSAVDDSVVWVAGHQATWARTVDGGRTWAPGAMTGLDSALDHRRRAELAIAVHEPRLGRLLRLLRLLGRDARDRGERRGAGQDDRDPHRRRRALERGRPRREAAGPAGS